MSLTRCHYLSALVAILCVVTGVAQAQYVEDSIDVGGTLVSSLAYDSRGDVLYGASEDGVFFVISCDSNKVVSSFPLWEAFCVAYDSSDNKAYCSFDNPMDSLVVDGVSRTRIKCLPMDGATTPVWDPVSDYLYVSCQTTNKVAVVDCATDSLLKYITVGACPIKMYVNTLRRKLYVLNSDAGTVSIVNMTTNRVIKTVTVGGTPNAGYYSYSADKFYCAGNVRCIVIDGTADTVVARIPLPGTGADIRGATGNESEGLVYLGITHANRSYVVTVRATDDSLVANTTVGWDPYGTACYDKSGLVYCASAGANEVSILSSEVHE